MHRIFGHEFNAAAAKTVMVPRLRGEIDFAVDDLEGEFATHDDGRLLLWMPLDSYGAAPPHPYVLGADIAAGLAGSHSSNSTLAGIDLVTMEQVLEFASNSIEPKQFADMCIAIANWLGGAYLAWEHAGPGVAFTRRVVDRGYGHVYHREQVSHRGRKKGKAIGWVPQPEEVREELFSHLNQQVKSGQVKIRSQALLQECGQYVRLLGKCTHIGAAKTEDDSSKGKAHGDRVIAIGVAPPSGEGSARTRQAGELQGRQSPAGNNGLADEGVGEESAGQ